MEQVSLDLQAEFPNATGFSPRNLWLMKQWFLFYTYDSRSAYVSTKTRGSRGRKLKQAVSQLGGSETKLHQVGAQLERQKLKQPVAEIPFPFDFGLVPWGHYLLILQRCKNVEEALFYIKKTIADNLSRSALESCIRAGIRLLLHIEAFQGFACVLARMDKVDANGPA